MSNMNQLSLDILKAVNSVFSEWSSDLRRFRGEVPARGSGLPRSHPEFMYGAFLECLAKRLPSGLVVRLPAGWSVPLRCRLDSGYRPNPWSQYDVAVFDHAEPDPLALLELAYADITVDHALHNGELKLLGICEGVSPYDGKTFASRCNLARGDLETVRHCLSNVAVRGLFFIDGTGAKKLKKAEPPTWHATWDKIPQALSTFASVAISIERQTCLSEVFDRLSESGLYCWFYSLCGEESVELPRPLAVEN